MLELIKYILQDINQVLGYAVCVGCITVVLSFGYVLFCKGIKRKEKHNPDGISGRLQE